MMSFLPFGDCALLINFEKRIDPEINKLVIQWYKAIISAQIQAVRYCSPAYCSLTVGYHPDSISYKDLCQKIKALDIDHKSMAQTGSIQIPVCYEEPFAPDMDELSQQTGLTSKEIVKLHAAQTYQVYMIGFLPGFAYMGTLHKKLKCKRRATPRLKVPARSVGLAGLQTGIYPSTAPGGWQIIGRTPLLIFDSVAEQPCRLQPGDRVTFHPITESEFLRMEASTELGGLRKGDIK